MRGTATPQQWQEIKSSLSVSSSFRRTYRLVGRASIIIDPVPASSGDTYVIEYVSSNWCETVGGIGQAAWAADTDELRLDAELFHLGLLWRAKRVLGMDYADDRADHDLMLRDLIIADLNLQPVNIAGVSQSRRPTVNIPEGSWGQ
jgi:hypothetical protein